MRTSGINHTLLYKWLTKNQCQNFRHPCWGSEDVTTASCLFKTTKQDKEEVREIRVACVFFGFFFMWKHKTNFNCRYPPIHNIMQHQSAGVCISIEFFFITNYLLGLLGSSSSSCTSDFLILPLWRQAFSPCTFSILCQAKKKSKIEKRTKLLRCHTSSLLSHSQGGISCWKSVSESGPRL